MRHQQRWRPSVRLRLLLVSALSTLGVSIIDCASLSDPCANVLTIAPEVIGTIPINQAGSITYKNLGIPEEPVTFWKNYTYRCFGHFWPTSAGWCGCKPQRHEARYECSTSVTAAQQEFIADMHRQPWSIGGYTQEPVVICSPMLIGNNQKVPCIGSCFNIVPGGLPPIGAGGLIGPGMRKPLQWDDVSPEERAMLNMEVELHHPNPTPDGFDGGAPDAGPLDAGVQDAGVIDAGAPAPMNPADPFASDPPNDDTCFGQCLDSCQAVITQGGVGQSMLAACLTCVANPDPSAGCCIAYANGLSKDPSGTQQVLSCWSSNATAGGYNGAVDCMPPTPVTTASVFAACMVAHCSGACGEPDFTDAGQ